MNKVYRATVVFAGRSYWAHGQSKEEAICRLKFVYRLEIRGHQINVEEINSNQVWDGFGFTCKG